MTFRVTLVLECSILVDLITEPHYQKQASLQYRLSFCGNSFVTMTSGTIALKLSVNLGSFESAKIQNK